MVSSSVHGAFGAAALPVAASAVTALAALRASGRAPAMASAPLAVLPWVIPIAGALSGVAAARGQRVSAAVLGGAAVTLAGFVAPRLLRTRQPDTPARGSRLTIMSANVYRGGADAALLVNHIRARHPDVLALQEQSPGYLRKLDQAGIRELLPHRIAGDGRRLNDAALLSRHPLEQLPVDLPSVFVGATVQLPSGAAVPVVSAHPVPPATRLLERHWTQTLLTLPAASGAMAGGVLAGDFNATLDHPAFRALLRLGWRDASAEAGQGGRSTWTGRGGLARLAIDHILVPPGAVVRFLRVDRLTGSDHRILTLSVDLPPA
ncbi:MAG: endonuclease/exonuclease/phosphatase family protein [Solirubrobacteraceae bacterium]|nr:endonuclease/exonuclease/phosphatase family protein [Solirubrobacteraceae bacterium]